MRLVAECPGKINLLLRVVDRRPDGFHELDTVFQTIDLRDRLEIGPGEGLRLICDDPGIPCDESNLVLRAVRLLERDVARRPLQASLVLRKSLPAQAGLGGGSSDAAGALLLGCRFWGLEPSPEELERLAAELGADVPFFLVGGTARGTGRGDRIEALEPLPETPLILGFPPFGVSTAEVF
ncbi:MAG: 4-(cytidine 5'-diphospho)-2-C-methyl-D-erythritol kinase, partial [Actinobacteria bacterium]|nr:4-(cytidine 5'-diphospho)-2-C-methyl-D-erythritol kinase [Actinomycetota bacterium]NIW26956.1 4-(cytidine 5'-diphospho)-2-C-methyl-D-erythritol kinase [Actinomycetota bacterium]NIX19506.1 4-(cytidine 5'-diphospho)-2-C-methyl-D-erythritol kinase [Actinomycetota bacterium]